MGLERRPLAFHFTGKDFHFILTYFTIFIVFDLMIFKIISIYLIIQFIEYLLFFHHSSLLFFALFRVMLVPSMQLHSLQMVISSHQVCICLFDSQTDSLSVCPSICVCVCVVCVCLSVSMSVRPTVSLTCSNF